MAKVRIADLLPWQPGSFLMDDGSAYDAYEMDVAVKAYPEQVGKMLKASRATYLIIERVMRE